jgi:hypothetical protein
LWHHHGDLEHGLLAASQEGGGETAGRLAVGCGAEGGGGMGVGAGVSSGVVSTGPFAFTRSADTHTGWLAKQHTCHQAPSGVRPMIISSSPFLAWPIRSKVAPGPRRPLIVAGLTIA